MLLFSTVLLLPAAALVSWTLLRTRHQNSERAWAVAAQPKPESSDLRLGGVPAFPLTAGAGSKSRRLTYPYSVVSGGVGDAKELRSVMAKDPVVARHYSDFNVSKSRIIELKNEKLAFVSYRIGSHVFWTRKKLRLAKGEKLITDGVNFARTRCGNRISETSHPQTSPQEPSPEDFDAPLQPLTANPTPAPLAGAGSSSSWLLVPPIIVVPGGGSSDRPSGSGPGPSPTPVPEPGTLLLVSSGVGYLLYRKSSKK